jgi:hypothetical protein
MNPSQNLTSVDNEQFKLLFADDLDVVTKLIFHVFESKN